LVRPSQQRSASFPPWPRLRSRRKRSACLPWTHRAGLLALSPPKEPRTPQLP
jgi:hypothetical protein